MRISCGVVFAFVCATSPAFGVDRTLSYSAGDTDIGGGILTFEYSGGLITRLVANVPAGDRLFLKGDALSFASDAVVSLTNGCDLVVSNAVTGAGDLSVRSAAESNVVTYGGDGDAIQRRWRNDSRQSRVRVRAADSRRLRQADSGGRTSEV